LSVVFYCMTSYVSSDTLRTTRVGFSGPSHGIAEEEGEEEEAECVGGDRMEEDTLESRAYPLPPPFPPSLTPSLEPSLPPSLPPSFAPSVPTSHPPLSSATSRPPMPPRR